MISDSYLVRPFFFFAEHSIKKKKGHFVGEFKPDEYLHHLKRQFCLKLIKWENSLVKLAFEKYNRHFLRRFTTMVFA